MTIYGTDLSHYDDAPPDLGARLVSEGFSFCTHKAGGDKDDAEIGAWWAATKDHRDRLLLGAYWVLLPKNGANEADQFLGRLDSQCLGWRDGPFILQADCEAWPDHLKPPVAEIVAFCDRLAARAPSYKTVVYASHTQYGDSLKGLGYPLWSARYPSSMTGPASAIYAHVGGDSGPGWAPYSGQTPAIWQFTSSATIAGQTTCDANAFRGSLADLVALVAPGWETDMPITAGDVAMIVAGIKAADINPNAGVTTTLGGAVWDTLNRTKALAGLSEVPSAADNAQAVLAALGAAQTPQEIADALRVVLGGQAAAVGALLAAS